MCIVHTHVYCTYAYVYCLMKATNLITPEPWRSLNISVVRPFRFWIWHSFMLRLHVLALTFIGILPKQPNWKFLSGPTVDSKVQVTERIQSKWQCMSGPTSVDSSFCACFVEHIWAAVAYLSVLCGTAEAMLWAEEEMTGVWASNAWDLMGCFGLIFFLFFF